MIPDYYYLMASLPPLVWARRPPMSGAAYLARCAEVLPTRARRVLESADLSQSKEDSVRPSVLRRWRAWEQALRRELARRRAERLRRDPGPFLGESHWDPEISLLAERIFSMPAPERAEEEWDRHRWRMLDELERGHAFDLGGAVIYLLKLRLLERRAAWDHERAIAQLGREIQTAEKCAAQACQAMQGVE